MKDFKVWFDKDVHDLYNYPEESMEEAFNAGIKEAAKRCKQIAQQRYLAENQAVSIDLKISEEFGV